MVLEKWERNQLQDRHKR